MVGADIRAAAFLPPHLASARHARSFVRSAIEPLVPGEAADTVELLTSEVVTNALLHARTAPRVTVAGREGAVRVAVEDGDPTWPVRRTVPPYAVSGRGIGLVDELASAWGVEALPSAGKRVWFEVRRG
jgi:anti-sigma regulatory factor (Ser/Thr protein kinase)